MMTETPSQSDVSRQASGPNWPSRLTPTETSFLEYVFFAHGPSVTHPRAFLALLAHAQLLSRGARPEISEGRQFAVPEQSVFRDDPIILAYTLAVQARTEATCKLRLSVLERDAQVVLTLTDTTTDKFGHLELSCAEHIRSPTDAAIHTTGDLNSIFPHMNELLELMKINLWKPVLPSPQKSLRIEPATSRTPPNPQSNPDEPYAAGYDPGRTGSEGFPFPDYGRSDLDPLGSLGGRGGMILDPRRHLPDRNPFGPGSFMGGPDVLPPGAVPPGARFDPFGPGVMPPRPGRGRYPGNRRHPDPDHALPPGFDDMFL